MPLKDTVILYHADCPDGIGSAFAAWKKFGDSASYVPVEHNVPYPEGLEGKEVYISDFSYPDGKLLEIEKKAKRLVVLDHHLGAKEWVEQVQEYVFDEKRSGAGITWDYFHPDKKRPELINYIEDGDLYTFSLPHSRPILSYIYSQHRSFEMLDILLEKLENPAEKEKIIELGSIYEEHFASLVNKIVGMATPVSFEGHECLLASASEMFASDVGHKLADKQPPIGIVTRAEANRISVSLRSDGSVNVADIAKKYGGGGHPAAAGFRIMYGDPIPWTIVKK